MSVLNVYIMTPVADISYGIANLFCHNGFKGLVFHDYYSEIAAHKLFEQIGEAVPQLSIAATFHALNWHWLSFWDKVMGMVTMTLSAGSILIGLVKGGMIVNSEEGSLKRLLTKGYPSKITAHRNRKGHENVIRQIEEMGKFLKSQNLEDPANFKTNTEHLMLRALGQLRGHFNKNSET